MYTWPELSVLLSSLEEALTRGIVISSKSHNKYCLFLEGSLLLEH